MTFDTLIPRAGSHCVKWDMLEPLFGLKPDEGLAMWVADMEFRPPQVVQAALQKMLDHGVYGYFGDDRAYLEAICWWMSTRHGWEVAPDWIFTTHGLVNGTALCVQSYTKPGDAVILMTPVYHAFARIIKAAGRDVTECPLALADGTAQLDIPGWETRLTGRERMLILCSPHNPGGRVWTRDELRQIGDFCVRHDLILVSDEIHHDLVFPGQTHTVMPLAAPDLSDRLIVMTATTKTFNIAGAHIGNVIIADPELRKTFANTVNAMGISPNSFGMHMATAAYSPEGAAWVDALMRYLDGNRQLFDAAVNRIPGLRSTRLEATYLAWVDFSGTGMAPAEFIDRVQSVAKIATNHGSSFGLGGESFLRFNLACPRAQVVEAVARLERAFADLQ
ncbi:MAG: pyridoxal phosphate-dependent aminotransferase [Tabrizicola sp.]|nr:pyridoxal phosphate-dependent aminotransferase [Tabrizicola sp.]